MYQKVSSGAKTQYLAHFHCVAAFAADLPQWDVFPTAVFEIAFVVSSYFGQLPYQYVFG